ncbi:MAG: hypothetical protein M1833_003073 [Piccolia ochrophora]|nr:MAG: hypothetical protein M1833_003073 [Piccolia ochrophora]
MASLKTLNVAAMLALPLFSAAGYYSTWGLSQRTGFFDSFSQVSEADPVLLPGTQEPVRTSYTGNAAIDDFLTTLTLMFWPCFDGKWPALSLHSFHFATQFLAVWLLMEVEARRLGNRWRLVSLTPLFGILAQAFAYANTHPWYLLLHLFTSPTTLSPGFKSPQPASHNLLVSPSSLAALPLSFTISYLIPAIFIALPSPSVTSFSTHQAVIATWQVFPLVILVTQFLLSTLLAPLLRPDTKYSSSAARNFRCLSGLRYVYAFAVVCSAVPHIAALTLSLSTILFPSIFRRDIVAALHPARVFYPTSPFSTVPVPDVGEGFLHFLHWDEYIGGLAVLLWAAVLYRNAHAGRAAWGGWLPLLVKTAGLLAVVGPSSTTVALIWARDEMVLGDVEEGEYRKNL